MTKIDIAGRRLNRYLAVGALLVCIYTLTGILFLPYLVKALLTGRLSETIKRPVAVEKVEINPYSLSMRIFGLNVLGLDGETFVAANEIHVNGQLSSLLKGGPVIGLLKIKAPRVRIVRNGTAAFNFSDLTGGGRQQESTRPPVIRGFRLHRVAITDGTVRIEDRFAGQRHDISGIQFSVPMISSFPQDATTDAHMRFSAAFNGAAVALSGAFLPFAENRRASLSIAADNLDVRDYLAYVPEDIRTLVDTGIVGLRLAVSYGETQGRPAHLNVTGPVDFIRWRILDRTGRPLIEIPEASVVLAPSNWIARQIKLARVVSTQPAIDLIRGETGRLNLPSATPSPAVSSPAKKNDPSDKAPPLTLDIDAVRVSAARVVFTDRAVDGPFQTILDPVDVSVERFTLFGKQPAQWSAALRTESGETVEINSQMTLLPLTAEGTLKLGGIVPAKYAPYYRDRIRFAVTDGRIGGETAFRFRTTTDANGPDVTLWETALSVRSLELTENGRTDPFAAVPELSVQNAGLDVTDRMLRIGRLTAVGGAFSCRRFADGTLNFQHLLATSPKPPAAARYRPQTVPADPWQVVADSVRLADYRLTFQDLSTRTPVRILLDRIAVTAAPLSTAEGAKSRFATRLRWNEKAAIALDGHGQLNPLTVSVAVDASGVDVRSLQHYFSDKLRVTVIDGGFSAKGRLDWAQDAAGKPNLRWRGEAHVNRFSAVDKKAAEDFIKWGALYMGGMDIGYAPLRIHMEKVALSDYFSGLVVYPDGTVNITTVLHRDALHAAEDTGTRFEKVEKRRPEIRVDNVTIQNGTLRFTDRMARPNFRTEIRELGGTVSGLSSRPDSRAEVFLSGVQENTAPMEIKGRIQPLAENPAVALKLSFKNIGLSPFSTYSGRYLGYLVEKGKLNMDLAYALKDGQLDAKNVIVLDQLTLGNPVESPEATALPVALAISLLKDRSGRIEIDLPVSGDIRDPDFKIGKLLRRMIVNLVTRIVTSPFAALGSLFGGGEDLSFVDFSFGAADIPEPGKQKLAVLGKALYERPGLRIEIQGEVDPAKDRESLRNRRFDTLIKAEKRKAAAAAGKAATALEKLKILPEEREPFLKAAWDASDIPKPRDASGEIRKLPVEEMEKLLRAHIRIGEDALRFLAHERASRVRDYLVGNDRDHPIDPKRIFILEPAPDFGPESQKHQNSRVKFTLK